MKRTLLPAASALVGACLLAGCASERLALRLDIYGDDPQQPEFTPQQLDSYAHALGGADKVIKDYAQDRLELGERLQKAYEAVFRLFVANPPNPDEQKMIQTRKTWWEDYERKVHDTRDQALAQAQAALGQVQSYKSLLEAPSTRSDGRLRASGRILLEQALADSRQNVQRLAGPLGTHFERSLLDNFDFFKDSLANPVGVRNTNALTQLRKEVDGLELTIRRLASEGSANMKALAQEMEIAARLAKGTNAAPTSSPLVLAVKRNPEAVATALKGPGDTAPSVPSLTTDAARFVAILAATRHGGDLDRYQDPADPVWRTLADTKNESRWHRAFATNYFYAEGNSSVIVVRDTPIHYRVMRGNNNPAALIQGQLRISRALTDAAIQIAGAAAGVKLPSLPKSGTNATPATAAGAASGTQDDKSLAEVNARIDTENSIRQQAYRTLRQRLNTLRADFERAGTNDTKHVGLLGQFESLLTGIAPVLKPDEPNPK